MALQWSFKERIGTWKIFHKNIGWVTYNLYKGNAFKIMLYEYEKDGEQYYDLFDFWADKQHMKNCLGQASGYDFIYEDWDINKITLYRDKIEKKWFNDFSHAVFSAFKNISIRLVDKEGDENIDNPSK